MSMGQAGLMAAIALLLVLIAVAATVLGHGTRRAGARPVAGLLGTTVSLAMFGAGALMACAILLPGFSTLVAAALAALLVVVIVVIAILHGIREYKTVFGLAVVDLGFMAGSMLLMPTHGQSTAGGSDAAFAITTVSAHPVHAGAAGSGMIWLVLLVWAFCTVVLVGPGLRKGQRESRYQSICSGCMIAAMAAMALTV